MAEVVQDDLGTTGGINQINQTAQAIADSASQITAHTNPLDNFTQWTYNLSMYILRTEDYIALQQSESNFTLPDNQLLMRSGGTPIASRSPFFADVDFSIDELQFQQFVGTQATGGPSATVDITIKITESSSVTFTDRLAAAVNNILGDNITNYQSAIYLIVVKFYGLNEKGEPISPQPSLGINDLRDNISIVRYIPFLITEMNFRIGNKVTEYTIQAQTPAIHIASRQTTNIVPIQAEFTGSTLEELFNAQTAGTANGSAPNINQAQTASTVYTSGLIKALNDYYSNLRQNGAIQIADQFEVKFDDKTNIGQSRIDTTWLEAASMNAQTNTKALNPEKSNAGDAKVKRRWDITAGTELKKFINQALKISSYTQQQLLDQVERYKNYDQRKETTQKGKDFTWWRIIEQVEPLGYDTIRKTVVYKTIYNITTYRPVDPKAASVPTRNDWPGAQRIFKYSFTGQNKEIMRFEQDFNYLYYYSYNYYQKPPVAANSVYNENTPYHVSSNNPSSKQGADGRTGDPAAGVESGLYSPADTAINNITIIGDPDLIMNATNCYEYIFSKDPYFSNGVVNSHAAEVSYVILLQKSNDFEDQTGLVNFNKANPLLPKFSAVYAAAYKINYVISKFVRGSFTQDIEGIQYLNVNPLFPVQAGDAKVSIDGSSSTNSDTASVAEEQRENLPLTATSAQWRNFNAVPGQRAIAPEVQTPVLLGGSQLVRATDTNINRSTTTLGDEVGDPAAAAQQTLESQFDNSGQYVGLLNPNRRQQGSLTA